ncbi:MAG: hypothetical protein ACYTFW_00995 [Planctomycetota bacterium]|jgi:hypothetical protein
MEKREEDPSIKLVSVTRHYPKWVHKGLGRGHQVFDLNASHLSPSKEQLEQYRAKCERNIVTANTHRAWGTTQEEKERMGLNTAFVQVFGANAIILQRRWRNDIEAQREIAIIRKWLKDDQKVVLFCHEHEPPCHRYILLAVILRERNLIRLFKKRKYPKHFMGFAERVQGQFIRRPAREI